MKKKNWLGIVVIALLISLGMSSCYYGSYGRPGPHYHHRHGHGYGHHGGYYR